MLLETDNLTREFGSFRAVDSVDLQIPEGELHSIIGPNGAGKTTLFNMISGNLPPTKGNILYNGKNITDEGEDQRARQGILRVFQITQIFPEFTILENMRLSHQKKTFGLDQFSDEYDDTEIFDILDQINLETDIDSVAENLPHGDKKKLEIGMGIAADPNILLLDEPTSGVSEGESQKIMELLKDIAGEYTILLIEHDVDLVLNISEKVTVLHKGEIISQGNPSEVIDDERVKEAYLGGY